VSPREPERKPGDKREPRSRAAHRRPRGFLRAFLAEQRRLAAIRPVAPPRLLLRVARWYAATVLRESAPHIAIFGLLVCGVLLLLGVSGTTFGAVVLVLALVAVLWELRLAWLAHRSTARIDEALEGIERFEGPRMPRSHLAFPPLMFVARSVERQRGIRFARVDGVNLRLDVYRPNGSEEPGRPRPAVIQVHGGGWLSGSRFEQGVPLLNHLAALGWVGFNIDYRLSPQATWPDQITDVKRAIAWVREHADEQQIDPELICITGGSAGGHLTALAALTPGDPTFQPGFEQADTSVAAAVPFYGVYDLTNAGGVYYPELRDYVFEQLVFKRGFDQASELYRAASPSCRTHAGAPPFLVIHGDRDTLVPVGDAREFVRRLREVSRNPVRYVELPGAEHAFDLWPSERTAKVAEAIGRFLNAVAGERAEAPVLVEGRAAS
jgi:acetyl esterase/lipase